MIYIHSVLGTSAGFGNNQKQARAAEHFESNYASQYVLLLSNFGTKTAHSVPSQRQDFAINWYLFSRLHHGQIILIKTAKWARTYNQSHLLILRPKNSSFTPCMPTVLIERISWYHQVDDFLYSRH